MARPRSYDDQTRAALLEAASAAIATGGPAGLSLRAVAADAGTSTSAVYALFGGRDALVDAVLCEGFRRFAVHLDAVASDADPNAELLALGLAYRENALENPHFYRAMFAPATAPAAGSEHHSEPTFAVLIRAVARVRGGSDRARADPPGRGAISTDNHTIAVRIWGYVHGLVSLELAGLLPGDRAARDQSYTGALRAARSLLEA